MDGSHHPATQILAVSFGSTTFESFGNKSQNVPKAHTDPVWKTCNRAAYHLLVYVIWNARRFDFDINVYTYYLDSMSTESNKHLNHLKYYAFDCWEEIRDLFPILYIGLLVYVLYGYWYHRSQTKNSDNDHSVWIWIYIDTVSFPVISIIVLTSGSLVNGMFGKSWCSLWNPTFHMM